MKTVDAATFNYLQRRGGSVVRVMVYVWATSRSTQQIEGLGLWTGEDDRVFTVSGQDRTYYRATGMLQVDEIMSQPGTDVFMTTLTLSPIDQIVRTMIGGYNLRLAPVEIHRALFWPESGDLVAPPTRLFKAWVNQMPEDMPEDGGQAEIKVSLASANRSLTRTLAFKKSDPALKEARQNDRFRRYTDVGSVLVPWGEARVGTQGTSTPPPVPDLFKGFLE